MWVLCGIPDGEQVFFGLVLGNHSPRFHGGGRKPLHLVGLPYHMFGSGESGIQVTSRG